jgi:hypothetical protein
MWGEVDLELRAFTNDQAKQLTSTLKRNLESSGKEAIKVEKERFSHRIREVQRAMTETSIARLEKERDELLSEMKQLSLIVDQEREQEVRLRNLEDELELRTQRYRELLELLDREQNRILEQVLPRRYTLRSDAQVFPVTIEIRLPLEAN